MKKRIKIITELIILVLVIVVGYIILFDEKESQSLEIKGDIAKITLKTRRGNNEYEYTDSEDIEEIMDYLYKIQYREQTIYEKLSRYTVANPNKYIIHIYARDKSILAEITLGNYGSIIIDDKLYILALADEELKPYDYLSNFIEEKESESVSQ